MTALQAIRQAQETGQIALTKQTANILEALATFEQAAEDLNTAIDENSPFEIGDPKTIDEITNEFYTLYEPLQEYIYRAVGSIMLKRGFMFQRKDEFSGF